MSSTFPDFDLVEKALIAWFPSCIAWSVNIETRPQQLVRTTVTVTMQEYDREAQMLRERLCGGRLPIEGTPFALVFRLMEVVTSEVGQPISYVLSADVVAVR